MIGKPPYTKITMDKDKLKENLDVDVKTLYNEYAETLLNNTIKHIKEIEPDIPDKIIRAFILTYMEINFEQEYDIRTKSYKLIGTCDFKDPNLITHDTRYGKLLTDYALHQANLHSQSPKEMLTKSCSNCLKYEYHEFDDGDYIRICEVDDKTNSLLRNPHSEFAEWDCPYFESF